MTTAFESYVEDLSNWYIRRSRRRFWDGEPEALETLWWSLVQALRVVAPVMPFLADHLWSALVPREGPDRSTSPAGPRRASRTRRCSTRWRPCAGWSSSAARRARSPGSSSASRCAGSSSRARRRAQSQAGEIADELSVKEVEFGPVEATELRVKPNLPLLGPKLGKELGAGAEARGRRVRGARRRRYASTATSSRPRR